LTFTANYSIIGSGILKIGVEFMFLLLQPTPGLKAVFFDNPGCDRGYWNYSPPGCLVIYSMLYYKLTQALTGETRRSILRAGFLLVITQHPPNPVGFADPASGIQTGNFLIIQPFNSSTLLSCDSYAEPVEA